MIPTSTACGDASKAGLEARRLWSLWDMIDVYGSRCATLVWQVDWLEAQVARILRENPGAVTKKASGPTPELPQGHFVKTVLGSAGTLAREIGLESTLHQVDTLERYLSANVSPSTFLEALNQLNVRIREDLSKRKFLYVPPEWTKFYEVDDLFGPKVTKKFPTTAADIKFSGTCLAVQQPTACVFHLMRAMEAAVRRLGKHPDMGLTITPQTTWRQLTGAMDAKIKAMPEKNEKQKRKKGDWESARANLHHVGSVWRNKTMHPAQSYTQSQALDALNATRVFMNDLCAL